MSKLDDPICTRKTNRQPPLAPPKNNCSRISQNGAVHISVGRDLTYKLLPVCHYCGPNTAVGVAQHMWRRILVQNERLCCWIGARTGRPEPGEPGAGVDGETGVDGGAAGVAATGTSEAWVAPFGASGNSITFKSSSSSCSIDRREHSRHQRMQFG